MEFGFLVCLYSPNFNNGKSQKKVLERNDVILVISVPSLTACGGVKGSDGSMADPKLGFRVVHPELTRKKG